MFLFGMHWASKAQFVDTITLQFDIGKFQTTEAHIETLQTLKKYPTHSYALLIYGFADYLGNPSSNKELSNKRVANVVKCIKNDLKLTPNILVQLGLGQVDTKGSAMEEGNPKFRTVQIIIRKQTSNQHNSTVDTHHKSQNTVNSVTAQPTTISNPENEADLEKIITVINKTPVDSSFVLEGMYFYRNTYELMPASIPILQNLLNILKQNKQLEIMIEGHICCNHVDGIDPTSLSYLLSIDRAKSIYDYLIFNGIAKERLAYKGFGTTRPIIANDRKESDAIKNRRVEIRIVAK